MLLLLSLLLLLMFYIFTFQSPRVPSRPWNYTMSVRSAKLGVLNTTSGISLVIIIIIIIIILILTRFQSEDQVCISTTLRALVIGRHIVTIIHIIPSHQNWHQPLMCTVTHNPLILSSFYPMFNLFGFRGKVVSLAEPWTPAVAITLIITTVIVYFTFLVIKTITTTTITDYNHCSF